MNLLYNVRRAKDGHPSSGNLSRAGLVVEGPLLGPCAGGTQFRGGEVSTGSASVPSKTRVLHLRAFLGHEGDQGPGRICRTKPQHRGAHRSRRGQPKIFPGSCCRNIFHLPMKVVQPVIPGRRRRHQSRHGGAAKGGTGGAGGWSWSSLLSSEQNPFAGTARRSNIVVPIALQKHETLAPTCPLAMGNGPKTPQDTSGAEN